MQFLLLRLKSRRSPREASYHPAFMGIRPTISHMCFYFCSSCIAEWKEEGAWIWGFIFLFLVLIRWNEEGRWVQDFLLLPQGFESFPSDLPRARWQNLVCGVFVRLSQWWLVFVLLGVGATLGDGCGIWEHLHNFGEVKCLQGYSKTLWMGI